MVPSTKGLQGAQLLPPPWRELRVLIFMAGGREETEVGDTGSQNGGLCTWAAIRDEGSRAVREQRVTREGKGGLELRLKRASRGQCRAGGVMERHLQRLAGAWWTVVSWKGLRGDSFGLSGAGAGCGALRGCTPGTHQKRHDFGRLGHYASI